MVSWTSSINSRSHIFFRLSWSSRGADLPQAGQLEDPIHNFSKKRLASETASVPSTVPPRKKGRKNRNKNRFSALEEDEAEVETEVLSPVSGKKCGRPVVISAMMREKELREGLLTFLADLLEIPDPDTVTRALVGLGAWSAQLWNMIAQGEDLSSLSLGTNREHRENRPEVGELLHTASDVLRVIPRVLQAVSSLATRPVAAQFSDLLNETLLEGLVRHPWNSFSAATWVEAKRGPSTLICECTFPIFTSLMTLVRLFKLQCRKLELLAEAAQLYLSPPLVEARMMNGRRFFCYNAVTVL